VFCGMSGWKSAIRIQPRPSRSHEMAGKFSAIRSFSALHEWEPIAGLRSIGKGANRTILDCLFCRFGRDKWSFLPPRGVAGAGSIPTACVRAAGCFRRLQTRKGLES
jgi:hypothetical protein